MLQQAIVISLFPEHEVRLMESLPESWGVKDFDVVIIDAASLRDVQGLDPLRAVQAWKVPTIWIDGDGSDEIPQRDKFVALKTPISRQSLLSALSQCLNVSALKRNGTVIRQNENIRSAGKSTATEKKSAGQTNPKPAKIIDLVEVFEEPPGPKKGKTHQEKKK
jgi:hypothetical protein